MKKQVVIIFSGYNTRAVIAFLRTLEFNTIDYLIVSNGDNDFIYTTKYSKNVILKRNSKALNYELFWELYNKLVGEFQSFVIAPSTEFLNQEILNIKEELEKLCFIVPLVEKSLYQKISDKFSFTQLCGKYNLSVPRQYHDILYAPFPFVAKPHCYKSEITNEVNCPVIIKNCKQLNTFLKSKNEHDFFYQDYIRGESFYLLFYFSKKGEVYKYSQKNLIQQPEGKSILLACPADIHNQSVSSDYENMFLSESFEGFVMVELKRENNEYFMIEANPRFWGPSQYLIDSGVNLFENFLFDYGLRYSKPIHEPKNAYYFWNDGSFQNINGINNAFHDYSLQELKVNLDEINKFEIFKRRVEFEE